MIYPRRLAFIVLLVFVLAIYLLQRRLQLANVRVDPLSNGALSGQTAVRPQTQSTAQPPLKPPKSIPHEKYSKVLVVARTADEDVGWIKRDAPDVTTAIYTVDNATAELTVPKNKGHEGMVYLTYILDNYDNLPDVSVFMHAHQVAWHNNDLLNSNAANMINSLSTAHVKRRGYFNMRCHWDPGCPDWMHPFKPHAEPGVSKPEEQELAKAFAEIFPDRPVPETMATPCCAQFALSREAILAHPKSEIEGYRQWLLKTELSDVISGRVWEYLWHYVFAGFEPIVCEAMDECYCDGFGICFGGKEEFKVFDKVRSEMRLMKIAMWKWNKEYEGNLKEGRLKTEMSEGAKGVKDIMEKRVAELQKITDAQIEVARQRGADPELRAKDVGRKWKAGDGY